MTRRRPWRLGLLLVVVLAVGTGSGWAAATVLQPAHDPTQGPAFTLAVVENGEIGSSITLNAVARWAQAPVGTNQAAGVVTSVEVAPGDEVTQGTVLYRVGLRPVMIAAGAVPAFRDIAAGTRGEDVAQLQEMLRATGHYRGTSDGTAGPSTLAALKRWQKDVGVEVTGVVGTGDIIFVPELPARITLDSEVVSRGSALSGGEVVVRSLSPAPDLTMPVTADQATMIQTGASVAVTAPDGSTWTAVAADRYADAETTVIRLASADGGVLCLDQCAQIPVTGEAQLTSQVVVVPTVEGLVVPSGALVTDASGKVALIDRAGTRHEVQVIGSARGMSVVDGVDDGLQVRVPGDAGSPP